MRQRPKGLQEPWRPQGLSGPSPASTGYAERQNLNMRMHTRRFTRLTNAFSKKIENHAHSVALFALYYNFARIQLVNQKVVDEHVAAMKHTVGKAKPTDDGEQFKFDDHSSENYVSLCMLHDAIILRVLF